MDAAGTEPVSAGLPRDPPRDPPRDIVDLLVAQHRRIEELFDAVTGAVGRRRQEEFDLLVRTLTAHEAAEEEIVHPLARRLLDGGDDLVDDRLAEERAAKSALAVLERMDVTEPGFPDRLAALRADILAHAAAEERFEFDRLRDALSATERRGMAAAVRVAGAIAPTHPHPGLERGRAHLLTAPALALSDRVRDLIRDAR